MLKALELVGFKSFADKTRFEFPPGITTVVGPNGSGKSNIVDAIKWVLGEQSVKSLRGKEMADVIFNGSGSRQGLNFAETTLTFNNADGLLPIDTPEVHITRRVYRSGEGEYLINRQPCRLRDIRDLFSGTGVATEAYSVIEQGKVDVLLQSSPRDRRVIFEEAAGISRFKAKKIESLRRLERVEQNLLRLADIVEEVENRLKGVRNQAAKARRYKELSDRLQGLRTQVGLADWRHLGDELAVLERDIETKREAAGAAHAKAEALEAQSLEHEIAIGDVGEEIRTAEGRIAGNRERIASHESAIEHERRRLHDLEEETARRRRELAALSSKAGDLEDQLHDTSQAVHAAEAEHQAIQGKLAEDERSLAELVARLGALRKENERRRSTYMEQMRSAASLGNEVTAHQTECATARAARTRSEQRIVQAAQQRQELLAELETLRQQQQELSAATLKRAEALSAAKHRLAERRQQHESGTSELNTRRHRHTGLSERAALLDELEKRQEGLASGVKELLAQAQAASDGPLGQIRGLVADLFQANVEIAPLIDVALGGAAQHLVLGPGRPFLDYLNEESGRFGGRVGFIRTDVEPPPALADEIDLTGERGVLGRADRFVETAPQYAHLARRLLGRTWLVEKLNDAIALSSTVGRGLNFVTQAGEWLAADGTLIVGPRHANAGLISRRSELRALREQIAELEVTIEAKAAELQRLAEEIVACEAEVATCTDAHQQALDALAEHRLQTGAVEERLSQADRQRAVFEGELRAADAQLENATKALHESQEALKQTETRLGELEAKIAEAAREIEGLDAQRQVRERDATAVKVQLAKSEERLGNLRAQMLRFEQDQQERQRTLEENRVQLLQCNARAAQAQRNILNAESTIAELFLQKEALAGETVALVERRERLQAERHKFSQEAQRIRAEVRRLEEKLHERDLAANEIRLQRETLAGRLRDDYGIELSELDHEPTPEERHQREEIDEEIAELRRKLNNIGSVNLEALDELNELEARFAGLSAQYNDLASAKSSLEQIIGKINADSRRLFAETLETVKGHFQTLFRKLFGGGHADIVLEEGVDILDSGIEIVARPPGKEPRSISLLSGGEKTLTCVALLLAIFRSRPSPFCVLDEVDAALDEANIERFISVLQEFLAWTQFIIVTHSKKTMTCANTLYGVTMQETGVSKRVSVRFEDVSENGEIRWANGRGPRESSADGDETQAA